MKFEKVTLKKALRFGHTILCDHVDSVAFIIILLTLGLLSKTNSYADQLWFDDITRQQETKNYQPISSQEAAQAAEKLADKIALYMVQRGRGVRMARPMAMHSQKRVYAVLLSMGLKNQSSSSYVGFGNSVEQACDQAFRLWVTEFRKNKSATRFEWTDLVIDVVSHVRVLGKLINGKELILEPGIHTLALSQQSRLVFTPREIWSWDILKHNRFSPIGLSKAIQIKQGIHGKMPMNKHKVNASTQMTYALDTHSFHALHWTKQNPKRVTQSKKILFQPFFRMHPMAVEREILASDLLWSARRNAAYLARSILPELKFVGFYVPGTSIYLPENDPGTQALTLMGFYELLNVYPNPAIKERADILFDELLKQITLASNVSGMPLSRPAFLEDKLATRKSSKRFQSAVIYLDTLSSLILAWHSKNENKQKVVVDKKLFALGEWLMAMQRPKGDFDLLWELPQMKMPKTNSPINKRYTKKYQGLTLIEDNSKAGYIARASLALKAMAERTNRKDFKQAYQRTLTYHHGLMRGWLMEGKGSDKVLERIAAGKSPDTQGDWWQTQGQSSGRFAESLLWQLQLPMPKLSSREENQFAQYMTGHTQATYSSDLQMDWKGGVAAVDEVTNSSETVKPTAYNTAVHLMVLARYLNQHGQELTMDRKKMIVSNIKQAANFLLQCQLGGERLMHIRKSHGGGGGFINHLVSRHIDLRANIICLLAMLEAEKALRTYSR